MGESLKGKNAVVTGAGRGIGEAVALALAEEGANVVVCDYGVAVDGTGADKGPAEEVAEKCRKFGVKAVANYGDVSDFKAAEGMIKACVDNFGSVDIVINIAGIDKPKMIFNMSEQEWDQVVGVHLKGTFNLCRHATPLMKEQGYGRIVNCVSEAYQGGPGHLNYAASKGGIATLTYGIARECGRYGITCNAFIPRAGTRMILNDEVIAGLKKRVETGVWTQAEFDAKMNELAPPEYMATIVAYLATDLAADINGQIVLAAGNLMGLFTQPVIAQTVERNWKENGKWPIPEIDKIMHEKLLPEFGYVNPAPKKAAKK